MIDCDSILARLSSFLFPFRQISSKYHAAPSPGDNTTTVIFIDNEGTLLERQQHASDALHATETVLNTLGRLHKEAKSL